MCCVVCTCPGHCHITSLSRCFLSAVTHSCHVTDGHPSFSFALFAFDVPGLHSAAFNGHFFAVEFLLENGADACLTSKHVDQEEETALNWAFQKGRAASRISK